MGALYCLAGLPGSGKTTFAKEFLSEHPGMEYFSPDQYYEKINGDECDRRNTFEVWHTMFGDIHKAEVEGKDVLIDSDNITYAQRTQWLEWFPDFEAHHLMYFERPFELCLERVNNRRRTIPKDIMLAKLGAWDSPIDAPDRCRWDSVVCL